MSHDIRTPLNAIIGLTYLAKTETDVKKIYEYLNNIGLSSDFLLGLINDILDMSKIESGELQLKAEPYEIDDFRRELNTIIKPLADAKQINFIVAINSNVPCIIVDKLRYNQIFFNLLSNAIKFTPVGGTVRLGSELLAEKDGSVGIRYSVKDSGIGMSEKFLPHIFEVFTQENSNNTLEKGSGLGLPIVKSLVDAMQGTISVKSELGKGTEFIVDLYAPVAQDAVAETQKVYEHYNISGKQILLVEDNDMNILVASKLLQRKGCVLTIAKNGAEAVQTFTNSSPDFFDAILMDVRMPVMDGLEATKRIRQLHRSDAATIPIIAMTADAFAEEQQKTIQAGMNAHLAKPINPSKLYEELSKQTNSEND